MSIQPGSSCMPECFFFQNKHYFEETGVSEKWAFKLKLHLFLGLICYWPAFCFILQEICLFFVKIILSMQININLVFAVSQSFSFQIFASIKLLRVMLTFTCLISENLQVGDSIMLSNWASNPLGLSFLWGFTSQSGQLAVAMFLFFLELHCSDPNFYD